MRPNANIPALTSTERGGHLSRITATEFVDREVTPSLSLDCSRNRHQRISSALKARFHMRAWGIAPGMRLRVCDQALKARFNPVDVFSPTKTN
jgi:hypothetical protein